MKTKAKRVPGWGNDPASMGARGEPQPALPVINPTGCYSQNQARKLLRVGKPRMQELRESGVLPFRWDKGRWIIRGDRLIRWIDTGKGGP